MKKVVLLFMLFPILSVGSGDLPAQDAAGKWTSSVGLGFTQTSGNSDITTLSLTFQAVDEMVKAKWSTNANLTYARTDADETANKGGIKTQYDYPLTARLFYFGKVGAEFDKFAELDLRTSPGGGLGYNLVQNEKIKLSTSGGANAVTDFFSNDTRDSRGTLSYSEEFSCGILANSTLYQVFNAQNNFEDFGDYLLDAEVSLTTKMSDRLSMKLSLLDKYDSTPFSAELKKNDTTFITSLTYSL